MTPIMVPGRVLTVGEALIRLVPDSIGPLETAARMDVGVGGAEVNVAIGLARQGIPVTWVGRVGNDGWGRLVARTLRAEGVDTVPIVDERRFTAAYVRERRAGAMLRAHYLRAGSAGSALGPADLNELNLTDFAAVHLTGITPALSESAGAAWERLIDNATMAGVPVVFDVNHRSALWSRSDASKRLVAHLPKVSVLLAGDDEAALLLNVPTVLVRADPLRYAKELLALVAPGGEVVLKLGRDGSVHLAADGTPTRGEALTVPVIDPVGAGDAFAAGWIAGWLTGIGPEETLQRAHGTAAFVVASPGDWEGLPSAAELPAATALTNEEIQR